MTRDGGTARAGSISADTVPAWRTDTWTCLQPRVVSPSFPGASARRPLEAERQQETILENLFWAINRHRDSAELPQRCPYLGFADLGKLEAPLASGLMSWLPARGSCVCRRV